LDFLGFPWILSSGLRLFNGLRGFLRKENFSRLFRGVRDAAGRKLTAEAIRKRRLVHGASLIRFLFFCKQLSFEPVAFGRVTGLHLPPPTGLCSTLNLVR
jgi:hypothetical protein